MSNSPIVREIDLAKWLWKECHFNPAAKPIHHYNIQSFSIIFYNFSERNFLHKSIFIHHKSWGFYSFLWFLRPFIGGGPSPIMLPFFCLYFHRYLYLNFKVIYNIFDMVIIFWNNVCFRFKILFWSLNFRYVDFNP